MREHVPEDAYRTQTGGSFGEGGHVVDVEEWRNSGRRRGERERAGVGLEVLVLGCEAWFS